jgi:thymidine kinase
MALGDPTGRVEIICGCMFCGKSEELLRRLRRVKIAKLSVLVIKPAIDQRYSVENVASHAGSQMGSVLVQPNRPDLIHTAWREGGRHEVVGIDEGQFFKGLAPYVKAMADDGARIIIAGLDLDYQGKPFLDPELLSMAEDVTKLTAVCHTCGAPAVRTQRMSNERQQVLVGATGDYEARCRRHWTGGQ